MIFLWYLEVSYSKILSSTIRLFQAVQCTYTTSHQVKKPRLVTWMGDRGHTVPKTVWNSVYKLHELVADGADAMEYVLYICLAFALSGTETKHIPLHLRQPWQARFLCGYRDSTAMKSFTIFRRVLHDHEELSAALQL